MSHGAGWLANGSYCIEISVWAGVSTMLLSNVIMELVVASTKAIGVEHHKMIIV